MSFSEYMFYKDFSPSLQPVFKKRKEKKEGRKEGRKERKKSYCCCLNENGPQSLMYLNAWFPVDGLSQEGLEGVAWLEKMCLWGWTLNLDRLSLVPTLPAA